MNTGDTRTGYCWKAFVVATIAATALGFVCGCSDDDDSTGPATQETTAILLGHSDCGGYDTGGEIVDAITSSQSAIICDWDGEGTLYLHHINAAFNCCPNISCEVVFEENTITVVEIEDGDCECLCLFDVNFKITGLSLGLYTFRFEELHLEEGDRELEFSMSLGTTVASDVVVVDRDHYPWGVEASARLNAHDAVPSLTDGARTRIIPNHDLRPTAR